MKKRNLISLSMAAVMMAMAVTGCSGSSSAQQTTAAATEAAAEAKAEAADSSAAETEAAAQLDFPKKDIQGAIMWAAGGACDNVVRGITPYLQDDMGTTIVLTNRAGAAGGISMQYVHCLLYTSRKSTTMQKCWSALRWDSFAAGLQ